MFQHEMPRVFSMEADKCTFLDLRQRRTSTSDSIGPPTASDFNLRRQHQTSDSVGLQPPTASDFISDSVGLLSPTASDRTTISDSVGLQSPTYSQLASYKFWEKVAKGARMPDDLFQMLKVYRWTGD